MKTVLTVLLGACLLRRLPHNCRRRAGKRRGNEHAAESSGDHSVKS